MSERTTTRNPRAHHGGIRAHVLDDPAGLTAIATVHPSDRMPVAAIMHMQGLLYAVRVRVQSNLPGGRAKAASELDELICRAKALKGELV